MLLVTHNHLNVSNLLRPDYISTSLNPLSFMRRPFKILRSKKVPVTRCRGSKRGTHYINAATEI